MNTAENYYELNTDTLKLYDNIWFISDTHFMHANIIQYCKRPFETTEEMDRVISNNWNELITPNDLVFFLGDFSMSKEAYLEILPQLQFKKMFFILGNHDRKNTLKEVISGKLCGEIEIYKNLTIRYNERKYFLTHRPINAHLEYPTVCGHVHEKWVTLKKGDVIKEFSKRNNTTKEIELKNAIVNVGVDAHKFYPVKLYEVVTNIGEGQI